MCPDKIKKIIPLYQEDLPAGLAETALALYYWDGSSWIKESTSVVDVIANAITAWPSHFSLWAALGSKKDNTVAEQIFLPVILKP